MKKNYVIGIIFALFIIGIIIFLFFRNNANFSNQNSNYTTQRSASTQNITSNTLNTNNVITENNSSVENSFSNQNPATDNNPSAENNASATNNATEKKQNATSEQEIANFSTKIYTKNSNRQNNIKITCTTLNNTEIKPGSTFSFCNTVGKATSAKGYKEADIFTSNGKKTKGLGGGNCQVSTTLYNAVLKVPELKVTERHEHSNKVPYIGHGKDAAVAYGSHDLKFVNNSDSTIKIKAENTTNNVTIKLLKLI